MQTTASTAGRTASGHTRLITSDRVEGTNVYGRDGDKLGSIDHLVIDKLSGQVSCAVLEFGGFLGMGEDRYPLPWNMLKYDTDKEGYVVPIGKEQLEGAPRYRNNERPTWDDDYQSRVSSHYFEKSV